MQNENKKLAATMLSILKISKGSIKDSQREKAPSNNIPTLLKSMNMGIRMVGILNQISIWGS